MQAIPRSFSERVGYFSFNVEENTGDIERQYLLGGGKGDDVVQPTFDEYEPPHARELIRIGNALTLVLGVLLLIFCAYEGHDRSKTVSPLLRIGIFIALLVMINPVFGLYAYYKSEPRNENWKMAKTALYINYVFSLLCIVLLSAFAIGTLVQWDMSGKRVYNLFFTSSDFADVQHRYLLWGLALASGLMMVIVLHGILGLDPKQWTGQSALYYYSMKATCGVIILASASIVIADGAVWYHGEFKAVPSPWSLIGSMLAACAFLVVGIQGMFANDNKETSSRLTTFLVFCPLVAAFLLFFSIVQAYYAQYDSSHCKVNTLVSGLLGVWCQLNTVVAINTAGRWKYYVDHKIG